MGTRHLAFETCHAGVAGLYFALVLGLTMCVMQPVCVAISLTGGLAFSCCAHGWRQTVRRLAWELPLMALIALINPLFSASGTTLLFSIGPRAIYLESVLYGACMGAMLVAALSWFDGAAQVLTSDRLMTLMGRRMPVVALMLSMTIQLAEQLTRRGRVVRSARRACTAAGPEDASAVKRSGRISTVLLSWALEDSIGRSDAMRARAWGAAPHRSAYALEVFDDRDLALTFGIGALGAVSILLAAVAAGQWHFYPTMPTLRPWWGYAPYLAFVSIPTLATLAGRLRWHALERKEPARG